MSITERLGVVGAMVPRTAMNGRPRFVVGLDLGDGESAIAWTACDGPRQIRLFERDHDEVSVVTALGMVNNEQEFGERALRDPDATTVHTNFKTRPERTGVGLGDGLLQAHFAKLFLTEFADQHPAVMADCVLFVGHPSGWPNESISAYEKELRIALHSLDIELVAESQSAFLHVHDEDGVDPQTRPVLVIDIGSSTIDFTLIDEQVDNLVGFGDDLGCAQIDKQIRDAVLETLNVTPSPDRLKRTKTHLMWHARRHKEASFAGVSLRKPAAEGELRWLLDTCWETLLAVDVVGLVSCPGGWRSRFASVLTEVREHLEPLRPELVLLSGGGSRMPFVEDVCREVFPDARTAPVDEPALSVARGLASYGRWTTRVAAFREGVAELTKSRAVADLMAEQTQAFAERLYKAWIMWTVDSTARPVEPDQTAPTPDPTSASTRPPDTTQDIRVRQRPFQRWLSSPDGKQVRDEVFGPLEAALDRILAPEAERLCVECGLPADALDTTLVLPPEIFVFPRGWLRDATSAIDKLVTPWLDAIERSRIGRWWIAFSDKLVPESFERLFAKLIGNAAAKRFGLTEDDEAKLTAAVREQIENQLLERARAIASLLT